jgi:ABC-type Fe3+/spermidine/putrescine transport system ATPase subunit
MAKGKALQTGTPKSIYNTPANIFVANFIGNTNFIEAMIIKKKEKGFIVSLLNHQLELEDQVQYDNFQINEDVYLAIKPEAIVICKESPFFGKVSKVSFLGHYIQYEIEFGNSFITATIPNADPGAALFKEGEVVGIQLPTNCLHILKK